VLWVVLIATTVLLADQLTKWLVLLHISEWRSVCVLTGFFQLVHWRNTGAAWGILQDRNLILVIISVLTIAGLCLFRRSLQLQHRINRVALGLISGGIVGNLVDRVRLGCVVDFLDFYIGQYHWPAFNIADSAICVGVALYILDSWRTESLTKGTSNDSAA